MRPTHTLLSKAMGQYEYLMLYDGLKNAFPGSEVFAFPRNRKSHMFQVDSVCRVDGYTRSDVVEYAQRLHQKLLAVEISENNCLIDLHFPGGAQGTLTFGIPGVMAKDVNKAKTTIERQLLRESLGSSEELFMQYIDDTPMRAADLAHQSFRQMFAEDVIPSRVYFMVLAVEAIAEQDAQYDTDIKSVIEFNIKKGFDHLEKKIRNPFCPGEDMHTDPHVRSFLWNFCESEVPPGFTMEEYMAVRKKAKENPILQP